MGVRKKQQVNTQRVASINNDYVRSVEKKENRQKAHKIRLYRRLMTFGVLVSIIGVGLISMLLSQAKVLSARELEKQEVVEALKVVEEEQEMLKHQITKLNDDEYIAKLARKELFLSEDGEIIFSIPEKDEKEKKK